MTLTLSINKTIAKTNGTKNNHLQDILKDEYFATHIDVNGNKMRKIQIKKYPANSELKLDFLPNINKIGNKKSANNAK